MTVIKAHQFFKPKEQESPVIILDNLITPENIGACLRLAGNIGSAKVIISGGQRQLTEKIKRIARNSIHSISIEFLEDKEILEQYPNIVAIETSDKAENIYTFSWPPKTAVVVGNEKFGIREDFLEKIKQQVYIPIFGKVQSLNVSHALAIALFEWQRFNIIQNI
jgi:tRNA G18 (ribose-2'-O)-methylase SpoU